MKKIASLLVAIVSLAAFTGCATTDMSGINPEQAKVIGKIAVQYGVAKYLGKHPENAQRVSQIAQEVLAVAGGDGANTVDLLIGILKSKINYGKLDAADAVLVNGLVDVVASELKNRVGGGVIPTDKLPQVKELASWIIEATAFAPSK